MEYNKLVTMNPSDTDLTVNHSIWLCSRLMPGKGKEKISFPHYRVINDTAMRTAEHNDVKLNGLIAMLDSETLTDMQDVANLLIYKGCWTINGQTVIGHCTVENGLVAPFNSFTVGYRYRRGWRPSRVD